MTKRKFLIGVSFVALAGLAVIIATQMPQPLKSDPAQKNVAASAIPALPGHNAPAGGQPVVPPPNPEALNKMNAMQAEIAKLGDDEIAKELETIKAKAQAGITKSNTPGQAPKIDFNGHPEMKDLMMRMALLRVEKAKRAQKPPAEKQGG